MISGFHKLNKRILIQLHKKAQDEFGGVAYEWLDFKELWAEIKPHKVLTKNPYRIKESIGLYKIIVRANSQINKNMRIKYGDQIFKIDRIMQNEKAENLQTIYCREE